jgi:hypothetical protein
MKVQSVEHVLDVRTRCRRTDHQLFSNLLVGQSTRDQGHDFPLACRQRRFVRRAFGEAAG